jgi:hypothetical protein
MQTNLVANVENIGTFHLKQRDMTLLYFPLGSNHLLDAMLVWRPIIYYFVITIPLPYTTKTSLMK